MDFRNSFRKELEVVAFRREKRLAATSQVDDDQSEKGDYALRARLPGITSSDLDHIDRDICQENKGDGYAPIIEADCLNLTGIAFSGGGIRSAAMCMGVLQALDSLTPQGDANVIDHLDYISAVSGGNYIATSLAVCELQGGTFPFESGHDGAESPETQHIRDYSNYLVPDGARDYAINFIQVIADLLVNAMMLLPPLFFLSFLFTAGCFVFFVHWPLPKNVDQFLPDFFQYASLAGFLLLVLLLIPFLFGRFASYSPKLTKWATCSLWLAGATAFIAFFEAQVWALEIVHYYFSSSQPEAVVLNRLLESDLLVVVILLMFGSKLLNVAKATHHANARSIHLAKHLFARAGLVVLGFSLPLLLWSSWLYLTYWAIEGATPDAPTLISEAEKYLHKILDGFGSEIGHVSILYLILSCCLFGLALLLTPNVNSLHKLYRDRLSRAFLMDRKAVREAVENHDQREKPHFVDRKIWKFSHLKPKIGVHEFAACSAASPYLLVNTSINIRSPYLDRRNRKADVFTLGPLTCGSHATGYCDTTAIEIRDTELTLAAGMAISGAALSANMGRRTIPALTFTMAALNIRLGYWLPNPGKLHEFPVLESKDSDSRMFWWFRHCCAKGSGMWWFYRELFGKITPETKRVHLTDGGHIDNLGLYELVKRRCRVIIVVDAEADPCMTFGSLITTQLLIRIDQGVRIYLPWPHIAKMANAANDAMLNVSDRFDSPTGPHVAIGRIVYSDSAPVVHGVLIYIKSSLSGDENDVIRDYKRRYVNFPHETTLDQFFSEEQFEVYRCLGYHIAKGFFTGGHEAVFYDPGGKESDLFLNEVDAALKSLGVPTQFVENLIDRARV